MLIEIAVLYAIYAIVGGVVVNTAVSVTGEVLVVNKKTNADKYVSCQKNDKNDANSCKGLE
jgi:hypothetical protein